jgi:hypothetical protein
MQLGSYLEHTCVKGRGMCAWGPSSLDSGSTPALIESISSDFSALRSVGRSPQLPQAQRVVLQGSMLARSDKIEDFARTRRRIQANTRVPACRSPRHLCALQGCGVARVPRTQTAQQSHTQASPERYPSQPCAARGYEPTSSHATSGGGEPHITWLCMRLGRNPWCISTAPSVDVPSLE